VIPDYPDPSTWDCLGHNGWTVTGCSQRGGSGDSDGGFAQLFDDNAATYWHSNWAMNYEKQAPHFFIVDLGEGDHAYDGFGYLPRQLADGGNGFCQKYAVYVTNDISSLSTAGSAPNSYNTASHTSINSYIAANTADAEGDMGYVIAEGANRAETRVAFTETKTARYVIFVFKTTANSEASNSHANCAEFNLYAFRPEAAVDHRPAGIAWLDNNALVQKVPVLFSADDIAAAKDAVNALAEDATLDEVMAAARTIYNAPVGKHVRFLNVLKADKDNENYYLGGIEDYVHYTNDESDLSAVWAIEGTDTPGAYRLLNYGYQKYAGYDVADNTHQLWSTTGEEFEFVIPTGVDNNCHIADANQLGIISHKHITAEHGYFHFATTVAADMKIVTWGIGSAASQWRVALA
ncbi:MAG: discoidin domain-containing protein, partial [Muribaculaceae bacterium]|nr:discoidin domain-containing protein [Muribaculaceae bacterium]